MKHILFVLACLLLTASPLRAQTLVYRTPAGSSVGAPVLILPASAVNGAGVSTIPLRSPVYCVTGTPSTPYLSQSAGVLEMYWNGTNCAAGTLRVQVGPPGRAVTIWAADSGAGLAVVGRDSFGIDEALIQLFAHDATTMWGELQGKQGSFILSGSNGPNITLGTVYTTFAANKPAVMPSITFANLANFSLTNGGVTYCTDCTIANPCAGSGTGAIAKRLNGVQVCN